MKKLLFFCCLIGINFGYAQIISIPDINFKNELVAASSNYQVARDTNYNWMTIDSNNDGEIQVSEAQNVAYLYLNDRLISSTQGINEFSNLLYLDFSANSVSTINISNLTQIEILHISDNNLSNINLSNNINLKEFFITNNNLNSIDVSSNTQLEKLYCNQNNLSTLNVNSNISLSNLDCSQNSISTIDVVANVNLSNFNCGNNNFSTIDVSSLTNLITLNCKGNSISSINLNNNAELRYLFCESNTLNNLDCSQNTNLINLSCNDNLLSELDLSANAFLNQLKCQDNTTLGYINLKNGNNVNFVYGSFSNFSNIQNSVNVCVDELNSDLTNFINSQTINAVFTEYCSLSPAQHNEITGNIRLDSNNNGCDNGDFVVPNKMVIANNGTEQFATFTQEDGTYKMYTNQGNFTTTLSTNLPPYNNLTPTSYAHNFTDFNQLFTADFCLIPNQNQNDVEVSILPLNNARPGMLAKYQLIFTNNGNTTISGDIQFNFDDSKLSFQNANPATSSENGNTLTFDYSNLLPFETRTITINFMAFAPPTVVLDDVLEFTVSITPITNDYSPNNNTYSYQQTVIDSYDPNDIHILEGSLISFSQKDKFLHYALRFQNTGSAIANNVVVKNILDDKLDWSTMELQTTSHPCRVVISNGNEVEFIFENIQLTDADTNEENSHGFIAYKIKPINTVQVDELIPNQADIFFDLNEAMPTNVANTKFVNTLALADENLLEFNIYPIPSNSTLNVNSTSKISQIEIYSSLGQLILKNNNKKNITVSSLEKGFYFCKVTAISGSVGIKKWMKN